MERGREGREGDEGGSTGLFKINTLLATYGGNRRSRLLSMAPGEQDRRNRDANQDSHLSPS